MVDCCTIGTGYVGLVQGVGLALKGNKVWGVDRDPDKIKMLRSGQSPIFEKGLSEALSKVL